MRSSTVLAFSLPVAGIARLDVVDVQGRRVRTLVNRELTAGQHTFDWDGADAHGKRAQSGIYFYTLETTESTQSGKMLLIP